jgi:hypothetical protein
MEQMRRVAFCPHCSNRVPQRLVHNQEYVDRVINADGSLSDDGPPAAYWVVVCETCGHILVYNDLDMEDEPNSFRMAKLQWPSAGVLDQSVPESVRALYEEATLVKNRSASSFAVQIRRALEAMCQEQGLTGRTLQQNLQELAKRNIIPPVLAEMTDVLRMVGNLGAHASAQSVRPSHVRVIDDFFRAVIEYVYVAPSRVKKFRSDLARIGSKAAPAKPSV